MADTKAIGKLGKILNGQIESGVELFKKYKTISKIYLKTKMDIKKNINNELEQINERRKKIAKRKTNQVLTEKNKKLSNMLNSELQNKKKNYEEISESTLVDNEKKFLKEKQKINVEKKKILSNILEIGKQIKSYMSEEEFNDFIKRMYKIRYEVLDNKTISFKTLMHHLESGQVSENVSKTTKKIDELMTIGNVVNRKKKMEIGIKQKEIQKLLENYEKTNKLSKESVKKEITNLVKSLNRITNAKKKEEVTTKIDRLSRSLKNEMTERERKIKYDIQIKTQELKKLQES